MQYGPASVAPQQGQGFGWGPQFGPPSGRGFRPGWTPQPPPPRKRSKGPVIAIVSVLLIAVAVLLGWSVISKNADNEVTKPIQRTYPTAAPTSGSTQPTQPTTTSTTPPAGQTDAQVTKQNKLYRTGKQASVNCKEPAVRPTNTRNAAAYWTAIKPCLDRAWAPHVRSAGYQFRAPSMTFWSGNSMNSPCGSGASAVPFYCGANEMLYMKVDVFVKTYNQYPDAASKAYSRIWYTRSIAHEYGHHVQALTGILASMNRMRYESSSYDGEILITRRNELQANCFAGVFLAANKRSYPINSLLLYAWNKWVVTAGDPPGQGTHGSAASQKRFMGRSFITGNLSSCNTYAAPAALVN